MYTPDNSNEQDGDTKLFRDVLEDARRLFAAESAAVDPVEHAHGFDAERCCRWSMEKTSADFAGYPLNIFFLIEHYPKRKNNSHIESWIVTTDLTLDFAEAREAAHLRWQMALVVSLLLLLSVAVGMP